MKNVKNLSKYLIPLASCRFTTGAKRALLCDLQRGVYRPVPLSLKELVEENKGKSLAVIYEAYGIEHYETLDEYFDFLLDGEYIWLSEHENDAERFIDLPLTFESYEPLQNAIIDVDEQSQFDIVTIVKELIALDCKAIQIRSYRQMELEELLNIVRATNRSTCRNIEFVIPYSKFIADHNNLEDICVENQRIGSIVCYNSPNKKTDWYLAGQIAIDYIIQDIGSEKQCGLFHPFYFTSNILHFTEAQQHNTCLYKKVSIDKNGYIKNCPSMLEHYGNIKDTDIKTAIESKAFKKLGGIPKDKIQVCKDCEYRYVCTDCRAYLENPANLKSKPLKCGYDPYTAIWQEWSTNPLKLQSIEFYNLNY